MAETLLTRIPRGGEGGTRPEDLAMGKHPVVPSNADPKHDEQTEEGAMLVDLEATIADLKSWSKVWKGYLDMFLFFAFFALYLYVLIQQLEISKVYMIDNALREAVVDESNSLQDVSTFGDFFNYLQNQIMPNVFPESWYNGDAYNTNESGYLLSYNKLVGGLLINQQRGLVKPHFFLLQFPKKFCKAPMYNCSKLVDGELKDNCTSSYNNFYPICYDQTPMETIVPKEQRVQYENVPWTVKLDEYRNIVPDQSCPPTSPHDVNATRDDPNFPGFWKSFTYEVPNATSAPNSLGFWSSSSGVISPQYENGGYKTFLALADGPARNQQKVQFLQDYRWLDTFTRKVEISFAVYNGMLHMFTFVKIRFGFSVSGTFLPFNTKGGTMVDIKSINMEPYRIAQTHGCLKTVEELDKTAAEVFITQGWSGIVKEDENGKEISEGGLLAFLTDKWTLVDALNYILFVYYIVLRISLIQMITHENNVIKVPTNRYELILERASAIIRMQLFGNFFNILLSLLRCFKFYRFQPRLAIINNTIETSIPDLYHFLLMFITCLFGFAVMSHVLFGPQMKIFATLGDALGTGWMMYPQRFSFLLLTSDRRMLGAGLDRYATMAYVDGKMAVIFYIAFMFLIFIILLNVLLAILVDSYMEAKDATVQKYGGDEDSIPSIASDMVQISRHLFSFDAARDEIVLEVRVGGREEEEKVVVVIPMVVVEEEEEMDQSKGGCGWREQALGKEKAALQLVKVKPQATVDELFLAIPSELRERDKISVGKVARNGGLQFVEEEEEEEEEEQVTAIKKAPQGRQLELLQKIVEEMQLYKSLTAPANKPTHGDSRSSEFAIRT
ncbi:hypothetical protein GUITHDRAFT_136691 [Guillardia theta CCMP2712]|uniref:Uncharacterized protein n=1 Tax=Guillardia theta (strain CCMP2712) TaxID=905079 RepID=L1JJA9_GUITC|nr:hypothetical protein GUITHDRAFT_136691 [Guillardia theta CCMP2712]EKX48586.1 hypothetical protein GUITHDRAFT_136691 [Guillardia theta CCMP2712]|eukprot:XP_005835566.1 hypothetical protein GUITHDRAFT_136691 [Guillardia theta CCMP2712]